MRSLRVRLILILALLSAAALACGLIMLALFQQSATAQIGQATAEVGHACDAIGCREPSWLENIELGAKKAIKRENIDPKYSHV